MARHMKQRKRAKSPLAHLYRAYKRSQSARSQNTDVAAVLGWLSQALDPHRPNDAHAQPTATGSTSRVRRQRTVLPNSASDEEDDDCDTDYRDEAGSGSATSSDGDETDSASDDESDDADTVEALESGDEDEDHHTRPQTTRSKLLFAAAELVAHDRPRKAPLPVTLMTPEEAKAAAAERLVKERLAGRYGGTTTGDTSDYDDEEALPAGNDVTALLEQAAANGAPENYLRAVERANKYLRESVARMKKRRIKRANRAIRATDGTFGDKSWLQEPFACHHCTPEWKANTKSKRPDMDLRHHYQSVHNYSWRKNTRRRWNWIPDDCLLPEDELELFAYFCRSGSRIEALKRESDRVTTTQFVAEDIRRAGDWSQPLDPLLAEQALTEDIRAVRRTYKLNTLLPSYLRRSVAARRDLYAEYVLESGHPTAQKAMNDARRLQEKAKERGYSRARLGRKIRMRRKELKSRSRK